MVERKLGREGNWGQAFHDADTIEIDPTQPEDERLDTIIHECVHLLFPDLSEMRVRGVSRRISRVLWRDKWRRVR
jgi:hypothetical protein